MSSSSKSSSDFDPKDREKDQDQVDPTDPKEKDEKTADGETHLRKGERTRTLTEKAKENKIQELTKAFWKEHGRCAKVTNEAESSLKGYCTEETLQQIRLKLGGEFVKQIESLYEELKTISSAAPDPQIRLGIDRIKADKLAAVDLRTIDHEESKSQCSSHSGSRSSRHSKTSHRSSLRSQRSGKSSTSSLVRDAQANAAAHKAELEAQRIAALKEEELRQLEAAMAKKKQELEQNRIEKLLHMEEAKLKVYQDELEREGQGSNLFVKANTSPDVGYKPTSKGIPVQQGQPISDIAALAEAFSASLSLSRLPAPEPSVFNGDPLLYNDWIIAFKTLIEDKKIPQVDKIHYLKRYLSGPAKEAVSGYFLLRSESAYEEAKAVLEERYGNQFVVTEAFRDKLEDWPKIQPKDGQGLRRFSDFLNQCKAAMQEMKGLEILNDNRENRKLLQKLPDWVVTRWSRIVSASKKEQGSYPNFKKFAEFISEEASIACDPVTSLGSLKVKTDKEGKEKNKPTISSDMKRKSSTARTLVSEGQNKEAEDCAFCKKTNHALVDCRTFDALSSQEKSDFVKRSGLCFGCLQSGHMSKKCFQRKTCAKCQKRHPTCLHMEQRTKEDLKKTDTQEGGTEKEAICGKVSQGKGSMSSMIVPVWLSSSCNPQDERLVYALLDTQSDTTFILEEIADELKAHSEPARLKLSTMSAQDSIIQCKRLKGLQVRGYKSEVKIPLPTTYSRGFIPTDRTHIPTSETARNWPHLRRIANQIPSMQDCEVGLLIGYNCPPALAPKRFITGEGNQPFAIKTDIGWSIIGGSDPHEESGDAIGSSHRVIVKRISEDLQLRKDVDACNEANHQEVHFTQRTKVKEVLTPTSITSILESDFHDVATRESKGMSQDDILFLQKMQDGIEQDEERHYVMPLPFRETPNLSNNREVVLRRFQHLIRRFNTNKKYHDDYHVFMEEILNRGDAERVPPNELKNEPVWYIPHHGVYHPKKPEKIRVVFDCSSRFQGKSLNEYLLQGPDLTNGLVGVLVRFRQEPIAIMCDVEKMFHQFKVTKKDQDFLRFLWFGDNSTIVDYRMKVHLFGATSSPGCANYGLKKMAEDNEEESPQAAKFIRSNFYVDDGLVSIDNEENAKKLVKEAISLCAKGNLRLHKFISNSREVMKEIPSSECAKEVKDIDLSFEDLPIERALGIQWCVESDSFQFRLILKDQPLTRRGILSTVASVYDPLGFLAPFILRGKQILQLMCKEGADWDEPLSEELRPRWEKWRSELPGLANVKIPRCFKPERFQKFESIELHHFSDASTMGYGQCSYLRVVNEDEEVLCSLVMAKSRVAPLKIKTIPRLELQAAVVSTTVSNLLKQELEYEDVKNYFWTDSKVVLGYIRNDARRFHVFVANRVQKIREASHPDQWRYVATEENPADHASRGLDSSEIMSSNWFTGPSFLWEKQILIKDEDVMELDQDDEEVKQTCVHAAKSKDVRTMLQRIEKFSDWTRAVKSIALLRRLLMKEKRKLEKTLSVDEREKAERIIVLMAQQEAFQEEIKLLKNGSTLNRKSRLYKFDSFLDEEGVLRVGGRLGQSFSLDYGEKHPMILPKDGHITSLVIRHCHEQVSHQGRGITVNAIRAKGYWILGISSKVSSYIYKCVQCRKLRGKTQEQKMADLPKERLEPSPPFTYCGFDCFGPFMVKERRKELKKYGLLFTCMSSRAVHIEMLDDMTTDAFINALRCFISLRGTVRQLRSDQGTNFIGGQNELSRAFQEIKEERVQSYLANQGCDFILNVPSASHMGGVWERQIRSVRNVLKSLMMKTDSRLDGSSLRTFFYEAMAIVNSRPLTVEDQNDPCGPMPLTPTHLLTMKSGVVVPPPGDFQREDLYGRKRWRQVQFLANQFWSRWKKEFLSTLQVRQRWGKRVRNVEVGDVVLVKDEDLVRCHWKLARVVKTLPSKDDLIRKVQLLMADSTLTKEGKRLKKAIYLERPVHKLAVLLENTMKK